MRYSFSNRHISNNNLVYKFSLWETWTNILNNIYIKNPEGKNFDIYNYSLVKKYKIDNDFLINNIDLLDKLLLPFFNKDKIWTNKDFEKNKDLFNKYREIFNSQILIKQKDISTISYSIKINIDKIINNLKIKDKEIIDKILLIWMKKSKKKMLDNMKYYANIVLYEWFLDISYINNLKIYDNNKIEFMLSKKSGSKKTIFYAINLEKILYYSFVDYYLKCKNKNIPEWLLSKFLQLIFEKIEKDLKNKNEYLILIDKIKQKLSYNNNDFYLIIESILLISLL